MTSSAPPVLPVHLFGMAVSPLTYPQTLAWLELQLKQGGQRQCVFTANVDHVLRYEIDPHFRRAYETADLVLADGMPLVWSALLFRKRLPERVPGIDLLQGLCQLCADGGYGCYLLGAHSRVIAAARQRLLTYFPGLPICGIHSGYFEAENEIVGAINRSRAQVLFVGMGSPRQELWLGRNWSKLNCRVALTVGGAFDVIAGKLRRAPVAIQQLGLEWLWRLLQEPRRLGRRYLVEGRKFLPKVWREWRAQRRTRSLPEESRYSPEEFQR